MSRRPTQRDVAAYAGVSPAVVSCVVSEQTGGNIRISEDTRQRVLNAIKVLNYVPDLTARSLSTQKSNLISVVLPDFTDFFSTHILKGIQSIVAENDFDLMVYAVEGDFDRAEKCFNHVIRRQPGGVILLTTVLTDKRIKQLIASGIQVVIAGAYQEVEGVDQVSLDMVDGVHQVVEHLGERGHRRIAFLHNPLTRQQSYSQKAAYDRSIRILRSVYDIDLIPESICTEKKTGACIASIFEDGSRKDLPTALFCENDNLAIEAMGALRKMNLRVPEDVAVAGFGNMPQSEIVSPSLTSLDCELEEMGKKASLFLIERMEANKIREVRYKVIQGRLIVRESTSGKY